MSDEEAASYQALRAEYDAIEAKHAEADELPDEVDARLGEIEEAMEAFEARPIRYEADDLALAGAFVSIDSSGRLRVERGYVRPEDEPVEEVEDAGEVAPEAAPDANIDDTATSVTDDEEEDEGLKPLSDRLVMELTAHRTLALRNALAQDPQVAVLAALHAMVLRLFYRYAVDSCVEIEPRNATFGSQVPGLGDTAYAQAIDQRHETWARNLPKAPEDLWEALTEFDSCSREALFRPLRRDERECRPRSLPAPTARHRACGCAGRDRRTRYGQGGLDGDRRQLPRPRDQGPYPRGRARGEGRDRR